MIDREKVIKESEEAIDILAKAEEPTFWIDSVRCALENAIVLLKEQEPVEPWLSYDGNEYHFHCTACDAVIYHNGASRDETKAREYAKFCRQCGRSVKWE